VVFLLLHGRTQRKRFKFPLRPVWADPGEFLTQAGRVIGVCLGLALLAQALVAMVGEY